MRIDLVNIKKFLMIVSLVASAVLLSGCDNLDGDDGAAGPPGPAGAPGVQGPAGADLDSSVADDLQSQIDDLAVATAQVGDIQPESCAVCHSGVGQDHQDTYDNYADASTLALMINGVASVPNATDATKFDSTMTFTITKNGVPYLDGDKLPTLEQKTFYTVMYNSATRTYTNSVSFSRNNVLAIGGGMYTVTATGLTYAPELSNAQAYAYIADELLYTEHEHAGVDSYVHLYNDVANAALAFGNVATYSSVANVAGCEKCHGSPYMKHGYRAAEVDGLSDFSACKSCHYDDRNGGHEDWQILVDNPQRFPAVHNGDPLTAAEKTQYAYKANLMNDVHMAHAMEFPYPQSMANCTTCHEGKMALTTTDANFTAETCKSCHPVTGPVDASGHLHDEDGERYTHLHRAPSLNALWEEADAEFHKIGTTCNECHKAGNGVGAPLFSDLHNGYDSVIYAANGTRYSDAIYVTIDDANLDGYMLTVKLSAHEDVDIAGVSVADVLPTLFIGLYGYNSHQYIVYPHGSDEDRNRLTEYPLDGTVNPRFTTVSAANGAWVVTADLSMWSDMIDSGIIKRAEIGATVDLRKVVGNFDTRSNGESNDVMFGMTAPSRTFDMTSNAFDDGYFPDIVDVEGCNNCHDLLGTTFHGPQRGGNIKICKMCHVASSRGSHLEMASRSIDNYVHAIHSFQEFDPGDVDFTDPLEAVEFELHQGHVFPNFTIFNCESCHNEGTYNVPDQSKSMPSLHAGTDTFTTSERNIGSLGQFVTGPASRACGSCHRAHFLKEDDAGGLAAFQQHVNMGGYVIADGDGVYDLVVETIMSLFD